MDKNQKREINLRMDTDKRVIYACEDSVRAIDIIINSLKLLKKSANKVYPINKNTEHFAATIATVMADVTSMKHEIEEVASETADDYHRLANQKEALNAEEVDME